MANLSTTIKRLQGRSLFGFFISIIVLALLVGMAYSSAAEYGDAADDMLAQSQTLALTLGKNDRLTRFSDSPKQEQSESYEYLSSLLGQFNQIPVGAIDSVFLLGQRTDGSVFFYVGSTGSEGNDIAPGTTYEGASSNLKGVFTSGISAAFIETNSRGSWLTGATPIKSSDGTVIGVVAVYSATSELFTYIFYQVVLPGLLTIFAVVSLLTILRRITIRQQAIVQQRSVFLTTTSHDIRSPLRGLLWALDLMKNPKADHEALIEKMELQLNNIIVLVESVLSTVRSDFALNKFNKKKQDVVPLLQKAIEAQRLSAEQYGITLKVDLPEKLQATVDSNLVGEILNNLITNAIKYSKKGTTVNIKAVDGESSVVFSVRDHGIGMTPEERSHLFESFYRTEGAKASGRPGTGMGLSMVKEMVVKQKGVITVESTPNQGSTFTVKLPK